ncbi:MAG: type II transport protein [Desulfobacter sp.]|nr:MAG: type II transport protein [Desulfobacter sp.]
MIEIMVVIAIAALAAVLAITQLQPQIHRSRTKSAARQMRADIQKAKLEAIKQNANCIIFLTLAAGGNPGSYLTCVDKNSDGDCDDAGDFTLSQLNFSDYPPAQLTSETFPGGSGFKFNSRGMPEQIGNTGIVPGSATIDCATDAAYSLKVVLAAGGRVKIE